MDSKLLLLPSRPPTQLESKKFFWAVCSWLDDYSYRWPLLCVQFLCVHADWLLLLFSFTVTLITARSMCRGWHFVLLAAWAPQKCAETLQERWKSSSKLPIPILGRRYFRKLLNTLLWIKRQDWLNTLLIYGILDDSDHTGWIFSQCARQSSKLPVCW